MRGRIPTQAQELAQSAGFDTYYAVRPEVKDVTYDAPAEDATAGRPIMPSVIFVRCTQEFAQRMRSHHIMWPMSMPGTDEYARIPQSEMEIFRAAVESGCRNLEVIDPALVTGRRVRVLDGIFRGYTGHIVKIRGDKRFVVTIPGIVALATIYIPRNMLEPA